MSRHDRLWFEARTATRHSSSSPLCYILEHFLLVLFFFEVVKKLQIHGEA